MWSVSAFNSSHLIRHRGEAAKPKLTARVALSPAPVERPVSQACSLEMSGHNKAVTPTALPCGAIRDGVALHPAEPDHDLLPSSCDRACGCWRRKCGHGRLVTSVREGDPSEGFINNLSSGCLELRILVHGGLEYVSGS